MYFVIQSMLHVVKARVRRGNGAGLTDFFLCLKGLKQEEITSLKSSVVKSVYFNHTHGVTQLILCHSWSQRQGCASHKSTNKLKKLPPKRMKYPSDTVVHFYILFLPHPQVSSALSQSEAMFVGLGECSQNMLSEAFWSPNTASSQFDEYSELYSRSKSSPNQEPTIFAEYSQLCSRTYVRPIKNGLYTHAWFNLQTLLSMFLCHCDMYGLV